jgi:hypothetical protein
MFLLMIARALLTEVLQPRLNKSQGSSGKMNPLAAVVIQYIFDDIHKIQIEYQVA